MVNLKSTRYITLIFAIAFGFGTLTIPVEAEPISPPVVSIIESADSHQNPLTTLDLGTIRVQKVSLQKSFLDRIAGSLSNQSGTMYHAEFQVFDDLKFIASFNDSIYPYNS